MKLTRTTITIRPSLLTHLKMFARKHNRSMSSVIEEGVKQVIHAKQGQRIEAMYKGLFALRASMKNVPSNPQYDGMSIDEILYGEKGAWRGNNQEED